ncbi:MAG: DUF1116 domain-containing protein [Pseudolabrys sp.]|nr:DUF1116 domain-containing protein [Pseudolabrys sp.]
MSQDESNPATRKSFARFLSVVPQLDGCMPLASVAALDGRTLLHAGPPFRDPAAIPAPVLNSAAVAAVFEGWVASEAEARQAIHRGAIHLAPAQDHGVVTPLAFVVSPRMGVLRVSDGAGKATPRYAPVNDGPAPGALRFGAGDDARAARLTRLADIGPALAEALREPIPVLPVMQAGLQGGDDLHGRVMAANAALAAILGPRLTGAAGEYFSMANQFVLNVLMAACAAMLGAGDGVPGSRTVTAAGGNGVDFGWKIAAAPGIWHSMPATTPQGPRFGNAGERRFLPAIGDSAVIDACGFGAAALRYAPEMVTALRGHVPDEYFESAASRPFIGTHPAFPPDLSLCLDIDRAEPVRGVILAAIDAEGEAGLIGRGVAPWPASDA